MVNGNNTVPGLSAYAPTPGRPRPTTKGLSLAWATAMALLMAGTSRANESLQLQPHADTFNAIAQAYKARKWHEVVQLAPPLSGDPSYALKTLEYLGQAWHTLGRQDDAIAAYLKAAALPDATSHVQTQLCWYLVLARRNTEAGVPCQRGVALDPLNRPAQVNLGGYFLAMGQAEPARQAFSAALDLVSSRKDVQSSIEADLDQFQREGQVAQPLIDETRAWLRQAWPPAWTQVPGLAEARARGHQRLSERRWSDASADLARALAISVEALGPQHAVSGHVAGALLEAALGEVLDMNPLGQTQQPTEAYHADLDKRVLKITSTLSLTRPMLPESARPRRLLWQALVQLLNQHGAYRAALPLMEQVRQEELSRLGAQHPLAAVRLSEQAQTLDRLNRPHQAAALHTQAVERLLNLLGPSHEITAEAQLHQAMSQIRRGEVQEAQATAQTLLSAAERGLAPGHLLARQAQLTLVQAMRVQGQDEAIAELRRKGVDNTTFTGRGPMASAALHVFLAMNDQFQDQGRHDVAVSGYEGLQAKAQQSLEAGDPLHFILLDRLAISYQFIGRYDQCLPLGQQLLAHRRKALGAHHPESLKAQSNLAKYHARLGQFEPALALQTEVLQAHQSRAEADPALRLQATWDLALLQVLGGQAGAGLSLLEQGWADVAPAAGPPPADAAQRAALAERARQWLALMTLASEPLGRTPPALDALPVAERLEVLEAVTTLRQDWLQG